jgi:ubiquinol-cytochrome c reductase iron-sulfur subunit
VNDKWVERRAALAFVVCFLAGVGLMVVYALGGQPQVEGVLLAIAFAGLAYGFVTWGNRLLPQGPFVQEREQLESEPEEREEVVDEFERGGEVTRRTLLVRALGLGILGLGAAAVFPIRSFGPRPGSSLRHTPWRRGLRLVTENGTPVQSADVPVEGLVTVFPEGFVDSASGQAILIRLPEGVVRPLPGREDWSPQGFIVYSKVCTHAGCPVGLYEAKNHEVLCPCHQSTFDVVRGGKPIFGPAAAALPQLPIEIDADGFIVAMGDFPVPVGPVFWHRS